MDCSRCGSAEAVVKRDAAFYCGRCALARDWEEVIALVQEERMAVPSGDEGPAIEFDAEPVEAVATAVGSDASADPFS